MKIKVSMKSTLPEVDKSLDVPYYARSFQVTGERTFMTPSRAGTINDYNAKAWIPNPITMDPDFTVVQKPLNFKKMNDFLTSDVGRNQLVSNVTHNRKKMQNSAVTMVYLQPTQNEYTNKKTKEKVHPGMAYLVGENDRTDEFLDALICLAHDSGVNAVGFPFLDYLSLEKYKTILTKYAEKSLNIGIEPIFFLDPNPQYERIFKLLFDELLSLSPSDSSKLIGIKYSNPKKSRYALEYLRSHGDKGVPYVFLNVPRDQTLSLSGIHAEEIIGGDVVSVKQPTPNIPDDGSAPPPPDPFVFFHDELSVKRLSATMTSPGELNRYLELINDFEDKKFGMLIEESLGKQNVEMANNVLKVYEFITSTKESNNSQNFILSQELKSYVTSEKPLIKRWIDSVNHP